MRAAALLIRQGYAVIGLASLVTWILEQSGVPPSVLELKMAEVFFLESPDALGLLLDVGMSGWRV